MHFDFESCQVSWNGTYELLISQTLFFALKFEFKQNIITPLIEGSEAHKPRQSQPKAYQCDGILYGFSNAILQKEPFAKGAFLGKTYPYITPYECLDIDTLFEFVLIEHLLSLGYPERGLE